MKFDVNSLPTFATEAARLATKRGNESALKLSIEQLEMLVKTWLYEALMEIRDPEEATTAFFTRAQAARELGIAAATLDDLERKGSFKYRWLGNRKVILQADLNGLITDKNIYNESKS